jgi:hypothetical protein
MYQGSKTDQDPTPQPPTCSPIASFLTLSKPELVISPPNTHKRVTLPPSPHPAAPAETRCRDPQRRLSLRRLPQRAPPESAASSGHWQDKWRRGLLSASDPNARSAGRGPTTDRTAPRPRRTGS